MAADRGGEFVDQRGIDQWFVALNVDDVSRLRHRFHRLGNAIRASRVVRRSHGDLAAERKHRLTDPLVIHRDDDFIQPRALLTALPNVLDQGFSGDQVQRLSRETGGTPTRRQNA